jgi:histidinol dehydrogenase
MNIIENPIRECWDTLLQRPTVTIDDIEATVTQIFKEVRQKGDLAINKYTALFDGVDMESNIVTELELSEAANSLSDALKKAIHIAKANILKFHHAQQTSVVKIDTIDGVSCWQEKRAIQKIGLYIPGGTAPLFSTVLMLALPAQIAGCTDIVLCTPPNSKGSVDPAILYAARECGVTKIIKVGGIQAIAGLTFGTESIPKVFKIFGPGNQFVTVAKQLATNYGVAIDMPAGPSELLVVADETANAAYVASDLLSQAEHGTDSQVVLVSLSKPLITQVAYEIKSQMKDLPRKVIAKAAMNNSKLIYLEDADLALDFINSYAPEHLMVCAKDEDLFINGIVNAGSVFIGNYTPESAGDYASGTNHTLPTNGFARAYSGVNLDSFLKGITFQKITKRGLNKIGGAIELMAEAEGLQAHKNAVSIRLKDIKDES